MQPPQRAQTGCVVIAYVVLLTVYCQVLKAHLAAVLKAHQASMKQGEQECPRVCGFLSLLWQPATVRQTRQVPYNWGTYTASIRGDWLPKRCTQHVAQHPCGLFAPIMALCAPPQVSTSHCDHATKETPPSNMTKHTPGLLHDVTLGSTHWLGSQPESLKYEDMLCPPPKAPGGQS
jgi:hypothetical protein